MTNYTLHTDESGSFEGELSGGKRLIAGLLLPHMGKRTLSKLRREFAEIAEDELGVHDLRALHAAGDALRKRPDKAKDLLVRRLLERTLACLEKPAAARLVFLTHAGGDVKPDAAPRLLSPAFAANRFQRMLAELVRQVALYVPGPLAGDALALHIASRTIEVPAAQAEKLTRLGYERVSGHRSGRKVRVRFGSKATVRTAFQTLMAEGWVEPRAVVTDLSFGSIAGSDDPRFVMADMLSNYVFRHFSALRDASFAKSLGLPLEVVGLQFGPALEALSRAADALNTQDVAGALDALSAASQPALHQPLEASLLVRLRKLAKPALRRDSRLADRLLDRAERILAYRDYSMLSEAERLARVVTACKGVSASATRRAYVVRGTVANHRGRYADGVPAFDAAIEASDRETPNLESFLTRMDLENRRAVAQTNIFQFDIEERLAQPLKWVDGMVRKLLGDDGRERVAGEIAGTLAQAAAQRRDWRAAKRHFAMATRHLGDDHMQASFRAHAAIERGREEEALEAAAEALGSSYGREGYDLDHGRAQLARPTETALAELEAQPFKSWLLLKLVVRGFLDAPTGGARERLSRAFRQPGPTHHPHMLIRLAAGKVLLRAEARNDAIKVWQRAYREFRAQAPTLSAIRLQLPAQLALAGAEPRRAGGQNARVIPWAQRLREDADALLERHPELGPWFGESVRQLRRGRRPSEDAIHALLDRFRFTYTS